MTFYDMLSMSLSNLWRRKLRTFLTVLGVLIGTASIVGMLSLALGMQKILMDEYNSYGTATQIQVSSSDGESGSNQDTLLTESNIEKFENLDHVTSVTPTLTFDLNLKQGKYEGYATLVGVDKKKMESLSLENGEIPSGSGGNSLQMIAGNGVITSFGYSKGDEFVDYYSTGELPDVDLLKKNTTMTYYDSSAMESDDNTGAAVTDDDSASVSDEDSQTEAEDGQQQDEDTSSTDETSDENALSSSTGMEDNSGQINFNGKITGVLEGGPDAYSEDSQKLFVNADDLKMYLKKNYPRNKIPGQPKRKNGQPYHEWVYNSMVVEVDNTENVNDVMTVIQDMGFSAQSNKELIDSAQKTTKIVELILGGIGMIAFLVAIIGIANTMMMSTYERTKEIGVMKVLGCDMHDILKMFLTEAGVIGFIGGVIGLMFTCGLSVLINTLASGYMQQEMAAGADAKLSLITWWLALIAVAFSTVMGMIAGFFPAKRAMNLSALAAIRNE